MNHSVRKVTITQGIATLEDATTVNLNTVQSALNAAFSETGDNDYAVAADLITKLTGQVQTARGFVTELSPDPETLAPNWSHAHCAAAQKEGWDIFDTYGSERGPWQLQRLDDSSEIPGAAQLKGDDEAWKLVLEGVLPHHQSARDFIRVHNPMEYDWALREFHPLRGLNSTLTLNEPAGYTIGGFTVGHAATMNGISQEATIVDVLDSASGVMVVLEFADPAPVHAPEGRHATRFEIRSYDVSSTWRRPGSEVVERFNAYVHVSGKATDPDDEGLEGVYQLEVRLKKPALLSALSPIERQSLAKAVLDEFHDRQGIEVLDDFTITAYSPDGSELGHDDDSCSNDLIQCVSFEGMITSEDLPFELTAASE